MSRNAERMQYQLDKLSYWLCMFSIVFNAVYFVSIYTSKVIAPDLTIGADVIINIIFMLIVFLGGEKLKAYQKKWNIYVILIGAVQILRIFFVPKHYFQIYIQNIQNLQRVIQTGDEATVATIMAIIVAIIVAVIGIFISGILLLLAGINSSVNLKILSRYDGHRVGE